MTPAQIAARAIAERRDACLPGERIPHPYVDDATAALAALEREGWVVTRAEPTDDMRIAALNTTLPEIGEPPLYEKLWRAMLAATPPVRE